MGETPNGPAVASEFKEDGEVLVLSINRPKGNIVSAEVLSGLSDALETHRDNKDIKLLVLRGEGSHFSYGASIEEHVPEQAPALLSGLHRVVRQLVTFPAPTAAVVEGRCLGAGFELVLCCQFVFLSPTASVGCPEIKLAVFPPVLSALGPLRLGVPLNERLVLTGANLSIDEAVRCDFATAVAEEPGGALATAIGWYKENLKSVSGFALRQAVRVLNQTSGMNEAIGTALDHAEAQYLAELLPSHDGNEGIAAFIERRKPVWTGA